MEAYLPLLYVLGIGWLLPKDWRDRPQKQMIETAIILALAVIVARYLYWRFTVTVWPVEGLNAQSVFVWTLFIVECVSWLDATALFMALARRVNRSPEADQGEARLRATDPDALPDVDIFIATYNEDLDVLEKTIIGAINLDWPRDRLHIHVLDDGRRDWLRDYCAEMGINHITRDNNAHAKAGNINAAITRTSAEFILVLDADFVPQWNFLYRAIGLFEDPKVGIVQIPHNFFNADPMQNNLRITATLPDDQRLFFDAIMPGRDGWDCAFCCGSNGIIRRSAIMAAGGGLPTGSITEDMLLTMVMLRQGFITRYLNERLAVGLAAESLQAFFVQRTRWARGAMQILFLKEGPFGPGLGPVQRLLFLPTHWLTQSLSQLAAMATPAIYLWTGLLPLINADLESVLSYQATAILGTITALRLLCPGQYHPLASSVHGVLQAFRLLPTVVVTLFKPFGHAFKVTPKGRSAADGVHVDGFTVRLALGIVLMTGLGLLMNSSYNLRVIEGGSLVPVVAFWSVWNMVVLVIVSTIAITPPMARAEERFPMDEVCRLQTEHEIWSGDIRDLSLNGISLRPHRNFNAAPLPVGAWLVVDIAGVGAVPAVVRRQIRDGAGCQFLLDNPEVRRRLIRRLFSEGLDNSTHNDKAAQISLTLLTSILRRDKRIQRQATPPGDPPPWVLERLVENDKARLTDDWRATTTARRSA